MTHISHYHKSDRPKKTPLHQQVQKSLEARVILNIQFLSQKLNQKIKTHLESNALHFKKLGIVYNKVLETKNLTV